MTGLVGRKLAAFQDSGFPLPIRPIFLGFITIVFLITALHMPVEIHADASYDDAIYIKLARSIVQGRWLGSYDQLTLIKGPGYPLFLALNALLGLPITLSTALLHALGVAAFFAVFNRLLKMPNIATLGYAVTLWAPATFLFRLARNGIYPAQTLLVVAAFCWLLFGQERGWRRILVACLAGVLTGWMAITREEGIWLVPGLMVLAGFAGYQQWQNRELRAALVYSLLYAIAAFLLVQGIVAQINKNHYGRHVLVEVNGHPFTDALGALQSVDVGDRIPHLPVPKAARQAIYQVSPAFRSLQDYFDGPQGAPWQAGCSVYPETCGDIAGGWFLWSLRSAASTQGHHQSAKAAARFYEQLAKEVNSACANGQLRCSKTLSSMAPHIPSRAWAKLPASLWSGIRQITFAQPSFVMPPDSGGSPRLLAEDVDFLGRPMRTRSPLDQQVFEIGGWYHAPQHEWISGLLNGGTNTIVIGRVDSPDLVGAFKDEQATQERFHLVVPCSMPCELEVRDEHGHAVSLELGKLVGTHGTFPLGDATLGLETVIAAGQSSYLSDRYFAPALKLRSAVAEGFTLLFPWLTVAALILFALSTGMAFLHRRIHLGYVLAFAVWGLLASRLMLLGLVDISSFPGMVPDYLAPAYSLISIACFLSLASFIKSRRINEDAGAVV